MRVSRAFVAAALGVGAFACSAGAEPTQQAEKVEQVEHNRRSNSEPARPARPVDPIAAVPPALKKWAWRVRNAVGPDVLAELVPVDFLQYNQRLSQQVLAPQ